MNPSTVMAHNFLSCTTRIPNYNSVRSHNHTSAFADRSSTQSCHRSSALYLGGKRRGHAFKLPLGSTKLSKWLVRQDGLLKDKKRRYQILRFSASDPVDEKDKVSGKEFVDEIISPPVLESSTVSEVYNTSEPRAVHSIGTTSQRRRGGGGLQWIFGPLALLVTGAVPALWLLFSALFTGSATAGLLAVLGLDTTFNMGATAFLLMANGCASDRSMQPKVPLGYKVWNFLVNLIGLGAPVALIVAYFRGMLAVQPSLQMLPAAVLLGPYVLLLVVQWLAEILVWQWRIAVWPVLPLVYQGYRLLQLTRGMELGAALDAPVWLLESARALVAWWVFVLGMQIMWVASLIGKAPRETAVQHGY